MKFSVLKISILILSIVLIILLGYGLFLWLGGGQKTGTAVDSAFDQEFKDQTLNLKDQIAKTEDSLNSGGTSDEVKSWPLYENTFYKYGVRYPNDWKFFKDEADDPFTKEEIPEGETDTGFLVGGATFWSNYDNFDDYNLENRPDDFFIMSLIVYKDDKARNMEIDQFAAEELGFSAKNGAEGVSVKGYNLEGKQFVVADPDTQDMHSAIVFKDGDQFYVFHLGFTKNSRPVVDKMLSVAKTFGLKH